MLRLLNELTLRYVDFIPSFFILYSLWYACQSNRILRQISEQEILTLWVKYGISFHLSGLNLNLTKALTPYYLLIVDKISFCDETIGKMLLVDSYFTERLLSAAIIRELEM